MSQPDPELSPEQLQALQEAQEAMEEINLELMARMRALAERTVLQALHVDAGADQTDTVVYLQALEQALMGIVKDASTTVRNLECALAAVGLQVSNDGAITIVAPTAGQLPPVNRLQ